MRYSKQVSAITQRIVNQGLLREFFKLNDRVTISPGVSPFIITKKRGKK